MADDGSLGPAGPDVPDAQPEDDAGAGLVDPERLGLDPDATGELEAVAAPRQGELVQQGALMALGTIISRGTGLLRDIAMTAALGLGVVADLFTVGNTIPNTVYVLTVGGAMNAVFVPQLVRRMREDSDGGAGFADRLITLTMVVLLGLTLVALLLAPWLTRIYASPEYSQAELDLATAFARFCLPQVFFYGLFTLLSQVLNARGRFGPPMYAPIANNLVAIAVFIGFLVVAGPAAVEDGTLTPQQAAWLGLGSTVAVAAQALLLVPFLSSSGYRWRPRFDWRGWGLGRTGGLAMWTLGLLAANQVSFIVHSRLATTANVLAQAEGLPPAGITTYQKAYLIFFLPHSIVTVSLVTALLPGLSRVAHAGALAAVSRSLADTTRTVTALVVPITAVLIPTAPLLASLLFGYGASGISAAQQIGITVMGMLLGLVPFSIYFILLRGWYAMEDTRTPFFLSLVLNGINVALSIGLFWAVPTAWKVPAIGLALGLTYWAMMVVAWPVLARTLGGLHSRTTWLAVTRMLAAGLVAGAAATGVFWAADRGLPDLWDTWLLKAATLATAGVVGLVAYVVVARLLGIREVAEVIGLVRRRLGR
ncbi:MAG: murein biosynthesis integral membrane protein MurJ [Candidatus Nanopelagicales bacterium]|nr:murein biosynthesis integral membrane protein MurJ [Candidatus Nanopelagicales bacterium]